METLELKTATWKNEAIKNAVTNLLENGYRVFVYKAESIVDATYSKDNKLAYLSTNNYERISISTKHKPNSKTGTGYGLTGDSYFDGIANPTLKDFDRGFIVAPDWANRGDFKHIVKYKNVDDWFAKQQGLTYKELISG